MDRETASKNQFTYKTEEDGIFYVTVKNKTYKIIDASIKAELNSTPSDSPLVYSDDLEIDIEYNTVVVKAEIGSNEKESFDENKNDNRQAAGQQVTTKRGRYGKRKTAKQSCKKSNTCDICGKTVKYADYLPEHRKRHGKTKSLKCSLCGKGFNVSKDLQKHIQSHLKERPYSCTLCGKSFTRSSLLNYHMRIHTGERPYKCEICQMTFSRPFGLAQHKQGVHASDEQRHLKCGKKSCKKMFLTKNGRDHHMEVAHSKKKTLQCSFCKKAFKAKATLRYHMKRKHSGEKKSYTCPSPGCDKIFKFSIEMQAHIKHYHKDYRYKCPHCPLDFKMKSQLNKHMKLANSHVKRS